MTKVLYTAEARVDGGRDGRARTSDGALDLELRRPEQLSKGPGTNPEQLFAVGYAACFASAVARVARQSGAKIDGVVIDATVALLLNDDDTYQLRVGLDVELQGVSSPAEAVELVRGAHQICPYSHAVRGNIDVAITANGAALA